MPKSKIATATVAPVAPAPSAADMREAAKLLWKAQQKVKAAELKLKPLKEERDRLEALLLTDMLDAKLESVATKDATISVKRTQFAELYDHKAFFEYVRKRDAFDLV